MAVVIAIVVAATAVVATVVAAIVVAATTVVVVVVAASRVTPSRCRSTTPSMPNWPPTSATSVRRPTRAIVAARAVVVTAENPTRYGSLR